LILKEITFILLLFPWKFFVFYQIIALN